WSLPLCAGGLVLHDPVEALVGRLLVVEPLGIGQQLHVRAPRRLEIDEGLAAVGLSAYWRRIAEHLHARHGLQVIHGLLKAITIEREMETADVAVLHRRLDL